jgi:hypothetical protein
MRASLDRLYEADFELEGYKAQAAGVAGSSIQQSEGESDSLAVFAGQSATRASTISPTSAPSSSSSSRRATSLTSIGASCARSKGSLSGCGSTSSPAVVRALGHRRGKGAPVARAANGGRRSGSRPGTHPRLAGDSHCAGERIAVVDHSFTGFDLHRPRRRGVPGRSSPDAACPARRCLACRTCVRVRHGDLVQRVAHCPARGSPGSGRLSLSEASRL